MQVQGLSDEDYDKVYRAGYQDGLEQAHYVSDYELADLSLVADYDSKEVQVIWRGDQEIVALTKTALWNMLHTAMLGEYTYVFVEESDG